jgi:predicted transcriptional regulator
MGLGRFFSPAEVELLQAAWALTPGSEDSPTGWTTISAVRHHLDALHNYKTVQTLMNRLVAKGLLLRKEVWRAHRYRPVMSRNELVAQAIRSVIDGLLRDFGDVVSSQLILALHETAPVSWQGLEDIFNGDARNKVRQ